MASHQSGKWLGILPRPHSTEGRWAVVLGVVSVITSFMWMILPGGGWTSLVTGFCGGVLALLAIIRWRERNWLVYLAVLPLVQTLIFFVGELFIPH